MAKNIAKAKTATIVELQSDNKRAQSDRRKAQVPVATDRRKVQRRRQIDPTTCEREYTEQEIEFMHAMDEYKRASGRMFPTCSEILEVLFKIGYRKVAVPQAAYTLESTKSITCDSPISVG